MYPNPAYYVHVSKTSNCMLASPYFNLESIYSAQKLLAETFSQILTLEVIMKRFSNMH